MANENPSEDLKILISGSEEGPDNEVELTLHLTAVEESGEPPAAKTETCFNTSCSQHRQARALKPGSTSILRYHSRLYFLVSEQSTKSLD